MEEKEEVYNKEIPRSFVANLESLCRFRAVAVVFVLLMIAIDKSSVAARKI
jgi:hypothetical protein